MTDTKSPNAEHLAGKGKFYDATGRCVDDCHYSLEVTTLEPDEIEQDGLPEFVTVKVAGTVTDTEQLILYGGLRRPLTLQLDDGRILRFRAKALTPSPTAIWGYGFYPTLVSDPRGVS